MSPEDNGPPGDITDRQSRAGEAPAAHSRIHVEKEVYAESPAMGRMFESPPPNRMLKP